MKPDLKSRCALPGRYQAARLCYCNKYNGPRVQCPFILKCKTRDLSPQWVIWAGPLEPNVFIYFNRDIVNPLVCLMSEGITDVHVAGKAKRILAGISLMCVAMLDTTLQHAALWPVPPSISDFMLSIYRSEIRIHRDSICCGTGSVTVAIMFARTPKIVATALIN